MVFLQNVWWFLVLIGVMIIIHELGHYWAARLFDVRVDTFSFGFGPRLFGFKWGDTDFRFSALFFFGGYVKMAGEQPGDENSNDPRALGAKPRWQRMIVVFAGPFMNIVLAVGLLTGLFMVEYPKVPNNHSPVIGYVVPNSAAAKAGIEVGDRIVQIGNTADPAWEDIAVKEAASAQHPVTVWVERDGLRKRFTVTPTLDPKQGTGVIGWAPESKVQIAAVMPGMDAAKAGLKAGDVLISADGQPLRSTETLVDLVTADGGKTIHLKYLRGGQPGEVAVAPSKTAMDGTERWMIGVEFKSPVVMMQLPFPQALTESVRENAKTTTLIFEVLRGIAEHRMSAKSLTGPIGIAQASGAAAREGAGTFFALMAMISLNLAIINLLPIPILDGAAILMLLIEMVMRRDLSMQVREAVLKLGFVFLMFVVAFVIYNDISKIAG